LAPGIYSPELTNEVFPLDCFSWLIIEGSGQDQTILDANNGSNLIRNLQNSNISLSDFTVTNGFTKEEDMFREGGAIYSENSQLSIKNVQFDSNTSSGSGGALFGIESNIKIDSCKFSNNKSEDGGAIMSYGSNIEINNSLINRNNGGRRGGGIFCDESEITLKHTTIRKNEVIDYGGGIHSFSSIINFSEDQRCNIYLNKAGKGKDIYTGDPLLVVVDTFSVIQPNEYFAVESQLLDFDILHGYYPQVDYDLFVSPDGSDSNSGASTQDPLQSITTALARITPDSANHLNIFLAEGTYSNSATGEDFPLITKNHISIVGAGKTKTILDGENENQLIRSNYGSDIYISDMKIINGKGEFGGGISCSNYWWTEEVSPSFERLLITNNEAIYGGGFSSLLTSPYVSDLHIVHNRAVEGGGLFHYAGLMMDGKRDWMYFINYDTVSRINVYLNEGLYGQDIRSCNSYESARAWGIMSVEFIVDTFSVAQLNDDYFAHPYGCPGSNILHGINETTMQDLYVSPEGSDENTGLSQNLPLKTIRSAITRIEAGDTLTNHIFLAEGTYSPATNGETFPLVGRGDLIISGTNGAIIDAQQTGSIYFITNKNNLTLKNQSLFNGSAERGGGIYLDNWGEFWVMGWEINPHTGEPIPPSNIHLEGLKIENCEASVEGGAIFMGAGVSSVSKNLGIFNNKIDSEGGIVTINGGGGA